MAESRGFARVVVSLDACQLRRRMTVRFMGYLMAFLVTWGFAIANRIVQVSQAAAEASATHLFIFSSAR